MCYSYADEGLEVLVVQPFDSDFKIHLLHY